jgi:heme oxygenase
VKARFGSRDAYQAHLKLMWGVCAVLEGRFPLGFFGEALGDYELRRKLPLLTRDLIALGMDAVTVPSLPRCPGLPKCDDVAAAFGCVYVLEGATLGGRTLLPLVETNLGLTAAHGAAFLSSYGDQLSEMWRLFGVALDAWCSTAERLVSADVAAVATFVSLDSWLCGKPVIPRTTHL